MPAEHLPDPSGASPPDLRPAKTALRDQLLADRRRRGLVEVGEASRLIAAHLLADDAVRRAATVAAYVGLGSEPGTSWLLEALLERGRRAIVPVLLADGDLDWAVYTGDRDLVPGRRGLLEPEGPRLGVDAVAGADVVVVPGLAVSPTGLRLGRGGGSYDRALGRVPVGTPTIVALYDGETGLFVPAEPHDRAVTAAVTPSGGIVRFSPR